MLIIENTNLKVYEEDFMRINDIDNITAADLIEHGELVDAFKVYLKNELSYDEWEVEIAATDMDNPYDTPYLVQEYEGNVSIAGVDYEVRSCSTNFRQCGMFHLADVTPFEFYMLFDIATMPDHSVGAYRKSRKVYVI